MTVNVAQTAVTSLLLQNSNSVEQCDSEVFEDTCFITTSDDNRAAGRCAVSSDSCAVPSGSCAVSSGSCAVPSDRCVVSSDPEWSERCANITDGFIASSDHCGESSDQCVISSDHCTASSKQTDDSGVKQRHDSVRNITESNDTLKALAGATLQVASRVTPRQTNIQQKQTYRSSVSKSELDT